MAKLKKTIVTKTVTEEIEIISTAAREERVTGNKQRNRN